MKKLFSILVCVGLAASLASCGCSKKKNTAASKAEIIMPDTLITATNATEVAGVSMSMTKDGVVNDGSARSVAYFPVELGSADPITVRIVQSSDTLTPKQVFDEDDARYNSRQGDIQVVNGIGEDCFIAYPYINIFDRGCYIRISAGSGDNEAQRDMLIKLANRAVVELEQRIPKDAVKYEDSNVIK